MQKLKEIFRVFVAKLVEVLNPVGVPEKTVGPLVVPEGPPDFFSYNKALKELESAGYTIRIRHFRYFPDMESYGLFATRVGYQDYLENIDEGDEICFTYKKQVSGKGGYTTVLVTSPEGMEFIGLAKCSLSDNFCRKTGRELALKRLVTENAEELNIDVVSKRL